MKPDSLAVPDGWGDLRRFTQARIALGRAGDSLPTKAVLEFGLAHARARDAVQTKLSRDTLVDSLRAKGFDPVCVHSAAMNRSQYLRHPDFGRRLSETDCIKLSSLTVEKSDLVFVIADGLSARAVERHAVPMLSEISSKLREWKIGPLVIAEQARVALGDEIGELLNAEQVVMLIGERPGLSSPDSLGVYLTYHPKVGRTDAERNCISNIRPEGLGYAAAAQKLHGLLIGARRLGLSGIRLKDETEILSAYTTTPSR